MLAIKETILKMSDLNENNAEIVINLVDYLSKQQSEDTQSENPFRKVREHGKHHWLSEDEIDDIIVELRNKENADRC